MHESIYTHTLPLVFDLLAHAKQNKIYVLCNHMSKSSKKCDLYLYIPKHHIANRHNNIGYVYTV